MPPPATTTPPPDIFSGRIFRPTPKTSSISGSPRSTSSLPATRRPSPPATTQPLPPHGSRRASPPTPICHPHHHQIHRPTTATIVTTSTSSPSCHHHLQPHATLPHHKGVCGIKPPKGDPNTSVNVNSSMVMIKSVNYVEMCNKCLELEAELIKQHNMSVEVTDLNAQLQEKVFVITSLKNDLRKLKGKDIVANAAQMSNAATIAQGMYKLDPVILAPKVKNNREAHEYYLKHTMEQAAILREVVDQAKSRNHLDSITYSACMYVKLIQELLGVKPSTSASRSKPSGNTNNQGCQTRDPTIVRSYEFTREFDSLAKNDRISRTPSSNEKNKVEVQSRKVKHLVKGAQALCSICNECLFDANHAMGLIDHVKSMNVHDKSASKKNKKRKEWKPTGKVFNSVGYKWKPTRRTFTLVRNACPLTRITATNKVPLRVPIPNSKPKVVQIVLWYLDSGYSKHMTGDRPQLTNFVHKFLGTVKFGNGQVAKIMGYGDYQIRNVTISRVYYVEGLGHNLFSVGQFCDSYLEVAFRKHTCFVRNLEGVDLLSGSRGTNLYSMSIGDMMASSPICLLSKATKNKSWLWHQRLSHLNFSALNHLARKGLVRGLPKLKFEKDHLCYACAMGKSKKQSHKPKSEDTNQEKLYLMHMDLCGPMRVASVNKKKYILVIVDDFSWFTWVNFLVSKDEAPDFIIKFLKMIQIRLNATVRNIRTDNGTEFVNQTLRDYYEQLMAMASEQSSLEPALHEMTSATPSSGLVLNPPPSALFVPPSRHEWDLVFQPVFDELFSPSASVASPVHIEEAPAPVESTGLPFSTTVDQDAPLPKTISEESSSSDVISTTVHSDTPISEHLSKRKKDHLLRNIIGDPSRPVSTRLQLHEQAIFYYYDALLTSFEPNTYKDALTQSCWIEAMQEELH
ncbi:retrovirus-related pol polyprotein from transposon TNT 1-94 [Tanacetum coccineum]|uniref:Retrovirus-related pol polyprotein from transposon TNT 1-94 n=1 Tax=Tanacetum coccineum TaxID=301880 RepID=A0ABQ5HM72_9ASTR